MSGLERIVGSRVGAGRASPESGRPAAQGSIARKRRIRPAISSGTSATAK
jgi:hypothetical protein